MYWKCSKCGASTNEKPIHKNASCLSCGRGRYRLIKTCPACGVEFHPEVAKQDACCREHRSFSKTNGRKGKHYEEEQRARVGVCSVCGESFRAVKDCVGRKQIYCSEDCWAKRSKVEASCAYCGKPIVTCRSLQKKYCGNECRNLAYRVLNKGEKSHLWKGGKTKISQLIKTSAEYREWRTAVLERDAYKCMKCGESTRLLLEAHHILGQAENPGLRFDIDNGITLCRKCHKQTHNFGIKARRQTLTGKIATLANG